MSKQLSARDVTIGKGYVCEHLGLIRIIHSKGDGPNSVVYYSHDLATGAREGGPLGCSRTRMVEWADREATPEERLRTRRQDWGALARKEMAERTPAGLAIRMLLGVPDDEEIKAP